MTNPRIMRWIKMMACFMAVIGLTQFAASAQAAVQPGSIMTQLAPDPGVPTPCAGCGPSGQLGDGTTVFVYPEHFCNIEGQSLFTLTYGVGELVPGDVSFTYRWSVNGGQMINGEPLETVAPGNLTVKNPFFVLNPGEVGSIEVTAVIDDGPPVLFGNGTNPKVFPLICDCGETTTTVATTTPTTSSPGTTVPGASTTPPTSSGGASTTVPTSSSVPGGELPATGVSAVTPAGWGLIAFILLVLGTIFLLTGRGEERA